MKPTLFRLLGAVRHRGAERARASHVERTLLALGADPSFVDAVFGDLEEERAARAVSDGVVAARWWYVREVLRSTPHLVASALRGASARRGLAIMLLFAVAAFAATFAVRSVLASRAPALLLAGGDAGGGVVVNNVHPVRLSMRVLDAHGRALPDSGVRYRWLSGAPIPVSPRGVVTCARSGDAVVRASLGTLVTQVVLKCRPVKRVRTLRMVNLIVGDSGVKVPFEAVDASGQPVSLLRGQLDVQNSSVATLDVAPDGTRIVRPRAPGTTILGVRIGDEGAGTSVRVFERVTSPEGIRPGDHLAVPVELGGGELRQWQLPAGLETFSVEMLPVGGDTPAPRLALVGANCVDDMGGRGFWCAAPRGATLFVFHSREGDPKRLERGTVAIWRRDKP